MNTRISVETAAGGLLAGLLLCASGTNARAEIIYSGPNRDVTYSQYVSHDTFSLFGASGNWDDLMMELHVISDEQFENLYSFGNLLTQNGNYVHFVLGAGPDDMKRFTEGEIIDDTRSYNEDTHKYLSCYGESSNPFPFSLENGEFRNGSGYIGLRLTDGTNDYYGWMQVTVTNYNTPNLTGTLIDWAYENTPGLGILAGALPSNAPPVAQCINVTVSAGSNCTATASIDDGSFDPDEGDTITLTQTPAGPYPLGMTLVTLTVTDNQGASNSCTATVTVNDTTPPTIICPADILVEATSAAGAIVDIGLSASDNCASEPNVVCSPASGSTFPIGITSVDCTALDGSSNQANCSLEVTVNGPLEVIVRVRSELVALRDTVIDQANGRALEGVIQRLTIATGPTYWIDSTHLQPEPGIKAFGALKGSASKLSRLAQKNPALAPALQSFTDRVALAARVLAEIALMSHANEKALSESAAGNAEAAAHRSVLAIGHYKNAWKASRDAANQKSN